MFHSINFKYSCCLTEYEMLTVLYWPCQLRVFIYEWELFLAGGIIYANVWWPLWTICVHVRDITSWRRPPNFQLSGDPIFQGINICGFPLAAKNGLCDFNTLYQGVTKRCRLSWLTNSALVYEPNFGGRGELQGSQPMSTAVHRSPNKLWRSNSIFSLCFIYRNVIGFVYLIIFLWKK